jgi:amidase
VLADYRVGVWLDDPGCVVDAGYERVLRRLADGLADAGAKVAESHPPVEFGAQTDLFRRMILPAITPSMPDETADAVSGSHRAWLRAEEERASLRAVWARWFEDWDVLLCPVAATPAFPHDHSGDIVSRTLVINGETRSQVESIAWTGLIGIVGLPSAVPPIGRTEEGLPVGVQVVAPFLHDRRAVKVAGLVAEVTGGYEPPPGFGR